MAGDWIKMRTNLDTDPRVIEMAAALGIPELQVVGCLWKVWAWADQHTLDGNAIRVTGVTLDRFTCVPGFADALRNVGWLQGRDTALCFPRFAEHNGQTAKKRAETKDRVAKHRNAQREPDVTRKALPEKRREEKINKTAAARAAVDFESLDLAKAAEAASKLAKAIVEAKRPLLERSYLWSVACVSEVLCPGLCWEFATKIRSRKIEKCKSYIDAAMRSECERVGSDWRAVQATVPRHPDLVEA